MSFKAQLPNLPPSLFRLRHRQRADQAALDLLTGDGSMTRALSARFGKVRVQRSAEGWQPPRPGEARLLGCPDRGGCWVREIRLEAAGAVRLKARTLVPARARSLQRALRRLGDRPLMDLLFRGNRLRPGVQRRLRRFGSDGQGGLARLTLFSVQGEPLLLIETLPPSQVIATAAGTATVAEQ